MITKNVATKNVITIFVVSVVGGTLTRIGDIGVRPYYDQSAVIDAAGKTMYWFANDRRELTNGYRIRRGAIDHNIPLISNVRLAKAFIHAFCSLKLADIKIKSWQEYDEK